jgi:hypothetical protein
MRAEKVEHYIQRATDFLEGAELMRTDPAFRHSAALLAIHSAISYSDALRMALGDNRLSADDHAKATTSLEKLLSERKMLDGAGFRHLNYLISQKSRVAYGDDRLVEAVLDKIVTSAQRFTIWVNGIGIKSNLEGWRS